MAAISTLSSVAPFLIFVVKGHMIVDGCIEFKRLLCTMRTGLVLPASVPNRGLRSASTISNCLYFIFEQFKIVKDIKRIATHKF